jgi:AraC-like DNA-binding protein
MTAPPDKKAARKKAAIRVLPIATVFCLRKKVYFIVMIPHETSFVYVNYVTISCKNHTGVLYLVTKPPRYGMLKSPSEHVEETDMADALNLEHTPAFESCRYYVGGEGVHTVNADPKLDSLLFLVRGELTSETVRVAAGRYYIFHSGDGTLLSGDNPEYFLIRFRGSFVCAEQTLPLSGRFDYRETVRHWNRLLEIADRERNGEHISKIERQALFCLILSQLYELSTIPGSEYLAQILMRDIASRFAEAVTLAELSEKYFYSQNYLIRVFRKKYGVTPYQHIIHMRIDKAKQLLSSTDMTCQQVAETCGYRDMSTFHKAFVSQTGLSPDRWRREAAKTEKGRPRGDYRSHAHALRGDE